MDNSLEKLKKVMRGDLICLNTPSENSLDSYKKLYKRNQSKFIRRSKLEVSHLGSVFEYDNKKLKLVGSLDPEFMLICDDKNQYYKIHSDIVTECILK